MGFLRAADHRGGCSIVPILVNRAGTIKQPGGHPVASSVVKGLGLEREEEGHCRCARKAHDQAAILPDAVIAVVRRRAALVHVQIVHAAARREVEVLSAGVPVATDCRRQIPPHRPFASRAPALRSAGRRARWGRRPRSPRPGALRRCRTGCRAHSPCEPCGHRVPAWSGPRAARRWRRGWDGGSPSPNETADWSRRRTGH